MRYLSPLFGFGVFPLSPFWSLEIRTAAVPLTDAQAVRKNSAEKQRADFEELLNAENHTTCAVQRNALQITSNRRNETLPSISSQPSSRGIVIDAGSTGTRIHFYRLHVITPHWSPTCFWCDRRLSLKYAHRIFHPPQNQRLQPRGLHEAASLVHPSQSHSVPEGLAACVTQHVEKKPLTTAKNILLLSPTIAHLVLRTSLLLWRSKRNPTRLRRALNHYRHKKKRIEASATKYVRKLVDCIKMRIPNDYERQHVPVIFKGTGGIRLLHRNVQRQLFTIIRTAFSEAGFLVNAENSLRDFLLKGHEEALYSWVSAYTTLASLSPLTHQEHILDHWHQQGVHCNFHEKCSPCGVIEMGGASAQVVVTIQPEDVPDDLRTDISDGKFQPVIRRSKVDKHFARLSFGDSRIFFYNKTFEGAGRQQALMRYLRGLAAESPRETLVVYAACLPTDVVVTLDRKSLWPTNFDKELDVVGVPTHPNPDRAEEHIYLKGSSDYEACRSGLVQHLHFEESDRPPTGLIGNALWLLRENFFWFNEYVMVGKHGLFVSAPWWEERAAVLCSMDGAKISMMIHPDAAPEKANTGCFGLLYMAMVLRQLLGGAVAEQQHPALNEIRGRDVSWPLGLALLGMSLGGGN